MSWKLTVAFAHTGGIGMAVSFGQGKGRTGKLAHRGDEVLVKQTPTIPTPELHQAGNEYIDEIPKN